jgi:hypothetical protein
VPASEVRSPVRTRQYVGDEGGVTVGEPRTAETIQLILHQTQKVRARSEAAGDDLGGVASTEQVSAVAHAVLAELFPPLAVAGRRLRIRHEFVIQQIEQLLLVPHVPVQGSCLHPEVLSDLRIDSPAIPLLPRRSIRRDRRCPVWPHRTCGRLRPACAVLWKKRPGCADRADRVPAGIVERPPPDERADDAGNGESVGDVLAEGERPTLRRM